MAEPATANPHQPEEEPNPDPNPVSGDTAKAVDFLKRHKDGPFFLYLPFNAQHAPLQAPQKYLDRFPQITDQSRKLYAGMLTAMAGMICW